MSETIPVKWADKPLAEIDVISIKYNAHYGALITFESQVVTEDEIKKVLKKVRYIRRKYALAKETAQ